MAEVTPRVIVRFGSHSEKEYFEKLARYFDGVILGANLIEATPGATSSLFLKLAGKKSQIPLYIDPMTYAYGSYIDPELGSLRTDLDWIKSEQKRKNRRDFKRSYVALAEHLGPPFETSLARGHALGPEDFSDRIFMRGVCERIVRYQMSRMREIFSADEEFKKFATAVPLPAAAFAPYFFIEPGRIAQWLPVHLAFASESVRAADDVPIHAVLCLDHTYLNDDNALNEIARELPKTGVKGVWFWFSQFYEDHATARQLGTFRRLVAVLSERMHVFNLHGGYFSLALSKDGMTGVSHGIGYGEQKDVVPVIGQSVPTVRYYLRDVHKRLGVLQIERCFRELGITTTEAFHRMVCECVVCRGILSEGLHAFSEFGDMKLSSPDSKRASQTPAAARRCRFHFLMRRLAERDLIKNSTKPQIVDQLETAVRTWGRQPSLETDTEHLRRWADALR